jgi:hypothetical protein
MKHQVARFRSEDGAVFVQVGLVLVILLGMTTFVIDYGIMWMSRRQAQNAADGGALAGAVARAYDDVASPPATSVPLNAATMVAQANQVWLEAPTVNVSFTCPAGTVGTPRCVRVDVYRNGEFGSNPLPMVFGPVFGISTQGVRATATAIVNVGNATDCMRPFGIPDKWLEANPAPPTPWSGDSQFNRYFETGPNKGTVMTPADSYTAPTSTDPGTGFTLPTDKGRFMTLKFGNPSGSDPISPGWYLPVTLPTPGGTYCPGGNCYEQNIASCNGAPVAIGDYVPTETGAKVGPTKFGLEALYNQDPSATFNTTTNTIQGSCAPGCAPVSPRLIALPVFDADLYQLSRANSDWTACPGGGSCLKIVNILGFFVNQIEESGDVTGYLMTYPGLLSTSDPTVGSSSSFLMNLTLIR